MAFFVANRCPNDILPVSAFAKFLPLKGAFLQKKDTSMPRRSKAKKDSTERRNGNP